MAKDIMTLPAEDPRNANIDDTFVGGQLVYERK
jgi:hypothetical protein